MVSHVPWYPMSHGIPWPTNIFQLSVHIKADAKQIANLVGGFTSSSHLKHIDTVLVSEFNYPINISETTT